MTLKGLDPVSARLFPSLAAYARKVRRRELLALMGLALSAYIIGRDALSAYQGRVATENMLAMVTRVNLIENQCKKEYPKRFLTTRGEAAAIIGRQDKERIP
jgi:hypothetical protein